MATRPVRSSSTTPASAVGSTSAGCDGDARRPDRAVIPDWSVETSAGADRSPGRSAPALVSPDPRPQNRKSAPNWTPLTHRLLQVRLGGSGSAGRPNCRLDGTSDGLIRVGTWA